MEASGALNFGYEFVAGYAVDVSEAFPIVRPGHDKADLHVAAEIRQQRIRELFGHMFTHLKAKNPIECPPQCELLNQIEFLHGATGDSSYVSRAIDAYA